MASSGTLEQLGKLMSGAAAGRPWSREPTAAVPGAHGTGAAGAGGRGGRRTGRGQGGNAHTPVPLLPGEVLAHAEAAWRCAWPMHPKHRSAPVAAGCIVPVDVNGLKTLATGHLALAQTKMQCDAYTVLPRC